jgi:spore coat protein U-like protein
MKNNITALFCLLLLLCSGSKATAATSEATATATIMPSITSSKNTETPTNGDLAFGVIVPGESSGTVIIAPSSSGRTHDGGVQLVSSTYGAASFIISGASNTVYTVTLPDTNTINISSGNNLMTVHSLTVFPPPGSTKLGSDGHAAFNVGGKLEVAANQPPGNYSGTFHVTVAYQ